ncbi:TonB-dependent receptor [Ciceribacter sp. L1K23]|uniref:TonB-dependent receptor n=1 Tax=Ciceribacter sp. L1K23 TaxID=2820276 RepID=UPI001B80F18D|nr:TonB-dependent receptor [Ciceribacter sp. L1K23]MBR0554526.1 TonB-dependent receptor [Ciceribacter sp. L1K23]
MTTLFDSVRTWDQSPDRKSRHLTLKAGTALLLSIGVSHQAFPQSGFDIDGCVNEECSSVIRGKMLDDGSSRTLVVGENTEKGAAQGDAVPFSISVDGQVVDESMQVVSAPLGDKSAVKMADRQRKADLDLSAVDIQVKFDGLDVKTMLNVSTSPVRRTYQAGEDVVFQAYSNYPAFITKAEIRIGDSYRGSTFRPQFVVPIEPNGTARWIMPESETRDFDYVLRVYDDKGRFNETEPLMLSRTDAVFEPASATPAPAPGVAEDRTAVRHIPVHGGAVTVYGRNVPPGYSITALGSQVPLDAQRSFVVQRILPPGDHEVDVSLAGVSKSGGLNFIREINIPQNEWFYVALADLTVGRKSGDDGIEIAREGEYDRVYSKGRLAFYLKGKIKGEYLLTASADTGEDDVKNLFRGLNSQSSSEILRRIDPDQYYPVYGDSSTTVEDAPTRGKLYIRLEKGDSHVVWGNFKTRVVGTEFAQSERSLYGAAAQYAPDDVTSFGEKRTVAAVYAAQPDSLARRDEFLATGGSSYFLSRQDVTEGSETVSIEYRSVVTGAVVTEKTLVADEDYTLDYFQGLLLLRRPASVLSAPGEAVRSSSQGSTNAYVIVQYEYTPLASDVDGYAHGARVERWINDKVRVGASEVTDNTGPSDHQVVSADLRLRHSDTTSLDVEVARSKGASSSSYTSTDGGLSTSTTQKLGSVSDDANAWKLKGQLDLADIGIENLKGTIKGSYENRGNGFSIAGGNSDVGLERWSVGTALELGENTSVTIGHEQLKTDENKKSVETSADVAVQLNDSTKITVGAARTELQSASALAAGKSGYNGSRIDGGLRADYEINDDRSIYGFAQGTVQQSGDIRRNDRIGVGGKTRLTEKVEANAEISHGATGVGGAIGAEYAPTADDKYYVGYRLDPDRAASIESTNELSGTDRGVITAGSRKKISDSTSAFAESTYDMFGLRKSLAQTYGIEYTPDALWSVDTALTTGSIRDETIDPSTKLERSDYDRKAVSVAVNYDDEDYGLKGRVKGEARYDDSTDDTRDSTTYVLASNFAVKTSEDWRLLAGLDLVQAHGESASVQNRDYLETSLGFAYRPVDNDKLNALFQYSYLLDLKDLRSTAVSEGAVEQRSHIVSADLSYDLMPWLTIGTKQALRFGDRRDGSDGSEWAVSTAYLGTGRLDLHLVKSWDALVEGRVLSLPETSSTDYGLLVALYRHVGEDFKVGVGYNFGRFTDDLRDLTLDDKGVFLNVVGKY